jgi:hypothetical protein
MDIVPATAVAWPRALHANGKAGKSAQCSAAFHFSSHLSPQVSRAAHPDSTACLDAGAARSSLAFLFHLFLFQ